MGLLVHRLLFHVSIPILIAGSRAKTRRLEEGTLRVASSFLYMAIVILILPSVFKMSSPDSGVLALLKLSRWCGAFLFILLGFLLFYTIRVDNKFWESTELVRISAVLRLRLSPLLLPITIAFALNFDLIAPTDMFPIASGWIHTRRSFAG